MTSRMGWALIDGKCGQGKNLMLLLAHLRIVRMFFVMKCFFTTVIGSICLCEQN